MQSGPSEMGVILYDPSPAPVSHDPQRVFQGAGRTVSPPNVHSANHPPITNEGELIP